MSSGFEYTRPTNSNINNVQNDTNNPTPNRSSPQLNKKYHTVRATASNPSKRGTVYPPTNTLRPVPQLPPQLVTQSSPQIKRSPPDYKAPSPPSHLYRKTQLGTPKLKEEDFSDIQNNNSNNNINNNNINNSIINNNELNRVGKKKLPPPVPSRNAPSAPSLIHSAHLEIEVNHFGDDNYNHDNGEGEEEEFRSIRVRRRSNSLPRLLTTPFITFYISYKLFNQPHKVLFYFILFDLIIKTLFYYYNCYYYIIIIIIIINFIIQLFF